MLGAGGNDGHGAARVLEPDHGKAVFAHEGDELAVGRELGVVAGRRAGEADLESDAVVEVVQPEAAVGVEEQVRGVWRPDVVGHLVAVAMVAVRLRTGRAGNGGQLGAAHQHVGLAGVEIEIDQFAAILIGDVLAIPATR